MNRACEISTSHTLAFHWYAVRSAVGWGTALSFGLYSGIVPAELAAALKALGVTKLFADAISQIGAIKDAGASIREESFYFLWRAKRLKPKRS